MVEINGKRFDNSTQALGNTQMKNYQSTGQKPQGQNLIHDISNRLQSLSKVQAIETLNSAVGTTGLEVIKDNQEYVYQNYQIIILDRRSAEEFSDNISHLKNSDFDIFPELIENIQTTDGSSVLIIDNKFLQKNLKSLERAKRENLLDINQINRYFSLLQKLLKEKGLVLKAEFDENSDPVLAFDSQNNSIIAFDWFSLSKPGPEGIDFWQKAMEKDLISR